MLLKAPRIDARTCSEVEYPLRTFWNHVRGLPYCGSLRTSLLCVRSGGECIRPITN